MEGNTNLAITGPWYDYAAKKSLLSVTDHSGFAIVAIATVWLSWSVKYIKKILGNLSLQWICRPSAQRTGTSRRAGTSERDQLLPSVEATQAKASPLAKIYKDKSGVRDLAWDVFTNESDLSAGHRFYLFIFAAVVASCGLGMIVGGYYAAGIRAIGPVLLGSKNCGLWYFDEDQRADLATRAGLNDLAKEERAAEYAENCYRQDGQIDRRRCSFFYRQKLPYGKANTQEPCPFGNDICRYNMTVTFTSPAIDSSQLGINSRSTHTFRRSTACAPLRMDDRYIRSTKENGTETFYYHYGARAGPERVNYTYRTVGHPWDRLAPVYDVAAYTSASKPQHWIPIAELTPDDYSTVTLFFVSSLRILYSERSDDPIFPADEEEPAWDDGSQSWFRNSDPRARPLACRHQIEICKSAGQHCQPFRKPDDLTGWEWTPEFTLLWISLYQTDIYDSVTKRQGRALKAQDAVSSYFSTPLGRNPWIKEVENMVAIACARTQFNAWSVSSGEDSIHADEGYKLADASLKACGIFKYNPQGFASLNTLALVLIALATPLLWVLSLESRPIERFLERRVHGTSRGFWTFTIASRGSQEGSDTNTAAPDSTHPSPAGAVSRRSPSRGGGRSPGVGDSQTGEAEQTTASDTQRADVEDPNSADEAEAKWEPLVLHRLSQLVWFIVVKIWILLAKKAGRWIFDHT